MVSSRGLGDVYKRQAQSALRIETLAVAEADAAAAGIAVRRSIVEKELALDELNRARASSATALATQQAAIADAERANMEAVLAAGTQNAVAADLAKTMAADRVAAAQLAVSVTATQEAAAVRPVSYTHLTLPTIHVECRSRWSPYH